MVVRQSMTAREIESVLREVTEEEVAFTKNTDGSC